MRAIGRDAKPATRRHRAHIPQRDSNELKCKRAKMFRHHHRKKHRERSGQDIQWVVRSFSFAKFCGNGRANTQGKIEAGEFRRVGEGIERAFINVRAPADVVCQAAAPGSFLLL